MAPITLHGTTLDPINSADAALLARIPLCEYVRVQLATPCMNHTMLQTLQANGLEIKECVSSDGTYLCRYPPRDYSTLRFDFVRFIVPYHPAWKVGSSLKGLDQSTYGNGSGGKSFLLHPWGSNVVFPGLQFRYATYASLR